MKINELKGIIKREMLEKANVKIKSIKIEGFTSSGETTEVDYTVLYVSPKYLCWEIQDPVSDVMWDIAKAYNITFKKMLLDI